MTKTKGEAVTIDRLKSEAKRLVITYYNQIADNYEYYLLTGSKREEAASYEVLIGKADALYELLGVLICSENAVARELEEDAAVKAAFARMCRSRQDGRAKELKDSIIGVDMAHSKDFTAYGGVANE